MTIADRVVTEALSWRGTPYRHQGSQKGLGVDCLGLVMGVYRQIIGEHEKPPNYSADWGISGNGELMLDAANRYLVPTKWKKGDPFAPGEVIMFRWRRTVAVTHAAICINPDQMIHAYNNLNTQVVSISDFWRKMAVSTFTFPAS